jgi:hypothetical protein
MPKVALYDVSGAQIGELELNDNIFGIEPNQAVLYDFVKMQLSNKRVGTAALTGKARLSIIIITSRPIILLNDFIGKKTSFLIYFVN